MLTCPKCTKVYADSYDECPHCGGKKAVARAMIGLVVLILAFLVFALRSPSPAPATNSTVNNNSDVVRFDPNDAIHKAQMDQLEAGAGACMQRAMHGLLMQGVRSRATLLQFAEVNCGSALKRFLVSFNLPEKAADQLIQQDAEDVLEVELK